MKRSLRLWMILFVVGFFLTSRAEDANYLVDQSHTFPVPNVPPEFRFVSIAPFARPVGPKFTPVLTALNVFELYTSDIGVADGIGAVLAVTIRDLSTRASMGTSLSVSLPDRFDGVTRFFFSDPVLLTPGHTYFGEIYLQSETPNWGLTVQNTPGIDGNLIQTGAPFRANAWFREGISLTVPEPATLWTWCVGVVVLAAGGGVRAMRR